MSVSLTLKTDTIGKPISHDSAERHVAGSATYVDDILEPEGCLHLAPGLSTIAAGTITKLDLSKVCKASDVIAVLTAKDIKGSNDCSPSIGGDPILADKEILFHGQVIFAVVAKTRNAARHAVKLADIKYKKSKPLISVDDGLKAKKQVLDPFTFKRGNAKKAIESAKHKIKGSMSIGGQEHFYLEGQASLAIPGEGEEMRVHCSTQHPSEVQHLIGKMLNRPDAVITCECRRMGGGFGGKESQAAQWACLAALASAITNKPCKMRLDRDDDMIATGKRHDFRVDYTAAFTKKGELKAVDVDFASRCGISADLSLGVNDRTMFHADNSYFYPQCRIHSQRVMTNTVSNTAFRGFGGPQGMVFSERLMDQIAIELDEDPLEIRRRNFYRKGKSTTPYGMVVTDNILNEIVDELELSSQYQKRRKAIARFNAKNQFIKKGIALNPVKFGIAFTLKHLNQAGALLNVYTDGSVSINHGGTEMGQGLYLKVAQVVAEEFGIDVKNVRITATTTEKVPNTTPTAASSGSDLNGMAAKNAAIAIKERMVKLICDNYKVKPKDIEFSKGFVKFKKSKMSFADVAKACFLERVSLSATGFYATPKITWEREKACGNPFLYFAYGASCSEVAIDTLTGEMKLLRTDILHDVGSSLNPAIDKGQIEGGFVQGMGWLTSEELVFDDEGRLRTHAPSTYKIPTCSDIPDDFNVALYKSGGKAGANKQKTIYRSKAVGEPPVMLATSVFSAITHAIASIRPGVLPQLDAPATPEAILNAIQGMKN